MLVAVLQWTVPLAQTGIMTQLPSIALLLLSHLEQVSVFTTLHTLLSSGLHFAELMAACVQVNVSKVGPYGGVDLNRAMSTIYNETRAFLIHNYNLTEDMVRA